METNPGGTLGDYVFNGKGPAAEFEEAEFKLRSLAASTQSQSEAKSNSHPSDTWKEYWQLCRNIVDAAGELAAKDKLLMNFRDPTNQHKVQHVIQKSFKGDVKFLKEARADRITNFFQCVDKVNWYAREHDLSQVSAMKLMGILEDREMRKRFRHHIQKHIDGDHPPFEMDEVPNRDFRNKPR